MIINIFSVLLLFMDALSAVLMIWATLVSIRLLVGARGLRDEEEWQTLETRSYLLLLIACVALIIRLIGWPFFYLVLWSFVPEIDGAMCIFGVTNVEPVLTKIMEIWKPFSFFLMGAWLIIHTLDRSTKKADLLKRKLLMLSVIATLVIIESVMEIWLIIHISPSITVSCCTTVTDILSRPTRVVPTSVLGEKYGLYIEIGYWAASVLMIGLMMALLWVRPLERLRRRRLWLVLVAGVSMIVTAPLFVLAMIETIGPRLMKLPYHHCLYCLWQYVPSSILIFLLFVLGTFSPIWAFLMDILGRKGEAAIMLPVFLKKLYWIGILSMGGSVVLLGIHHLLLIGG